MSAHIVGITWLWAQIYSPGLFGIGGINKITGQKVFHSATVHLTSLCWEKKENKIECPCHSQLFLPPLFSSSSPLPWEIKFPCGSRISCTARWFIRDAKSMQKQSLLHPFPACQPGSCWLFIKGAAQVRRMHPDALIDCLLPCGDSSWMDWAAGGKEGEKKSADSVAAPVRHTFTESASVISALASAHAAAADTPWTSARSPTSCMDDALTPPASKRNYFVHFPAPYNTKVSHHLLLFKKKKDKINLNFTH